MRRFYVGTGVILLGAGGLLFHRLSGTPWIPPAPFDVIGFLWLLQNFPKLVLWLGTWILVALGLLCFVQAVRTPSMRATLRAEQRRLLGHMIATAPTSGPSSREGASPHGGDPGDAGAKTGEGSADE